MAVTCLSAGIAAAQIGGGYGGPGVLSNGIGDIGARSGQQVNLRFYGSVTGVYDSGVEPLGVDSKGNLITLNGLYGIEGSAGVYGVHAWKRAQLGVDYRGTIREYENGPGGINGTDQFLTLGYTYQKSRRLSLDVRQLGGVISYGTGGLANSVATSAQDNSVAQPYSILFDSRYYFYQSTADANFAITSRTGFSVGGDGYEVFQSSSQLAGVEGYDLRGTLQHKLSRNSTIGVMYTHTHYDFPHFFGNSTIDMGQAFYNAQIGRRWNMSLRAGVFVAQVSGTQQVTLSAAVAALLGGQTTSYQAYSSTLLYPSGTASVSRGFKNSSLNFHYGRTVTPGNGVYLTSVTDDGGAGYSYTGIRKWNLGVQGSYSRLGAIGLNLQPYATYSGGGGFTYTVSHGFHIVGRYDARHQDITAAGYRQTGYRATIGVAFSPGSVPLSLW